MDTILLQMPLDGEGGLGIVVEVDSVDLEDIELVSDDDGGRLVKAAGSLSEAFDKLQPALGMIVTRLRDSTRQPDSINVQFGLKIGGETGFVFAKGTAEANLTVSVTWQRPAEAVNGSAR